MVFSFFQREQDRDLAPSPLIAGIGEAAVAVPEIPRHRDLIFAAKKILSAEDALAPEVREKAIRGGTRVLADQAACPFRAFARWRLGARSLEAPAERLDAAGRGKLLHALMSALWGELKESAALQKDFEPAIARAAAAAVKALALEGRFAELERARLARLAREWLEVEGSRKPFQVASIEEKRKIEIAGLEFSGRIDRMDRTAEGGNVLIDYKTGRASPKEWEPPRPDDPQLPIYAVSAKEEITGVAFASLKPGKLRYMGFSRDKNALPGVQQAKDWKAVLRGWKKETEALGAAFAKGDARVDPKKSLQTCRYCDLQTLCRVFEKANALEEDVPE